MARGMLSIALLLMAATATDGMIMTVLGTGSVTEFAFYEEYTLSASISTSAQYYVAWTSLFPQPIVSVAFGLSASGVYSAFLLAPSINSTTNTLIISIPVQQYLMGPSTTFSLSNPNVQTWQCSATAGVGGDSATCTGLQQLAISSSGALIVLKTAVVAGGATDMWISPIVWGSSQTSPLTFTINEAALNNPTTPLTAPAAGPYVGFGQSIQAPYPYYLLTSNQIFSGTIQSQFSLETVVFSGAVAGTIDCQGRVLFASGAGPHVAHHVTTNWWTLSTSSTIQGPITAMATFDCPSPEIVEYDLVTTTLVPIGTNGAAVPLSTITQVENNVGMYSTAQTTMTIGAPSGTILSPYTVLDYWGPYISSSNEYFVDYWLKIPSNAAGSTFTFTINNNPPGQVVTIAQITVTVNAAITATTSLSISFTDYHPTTTSKTINMPGLNTNPWVHVVFRADWNTVAVWLRGSQPDTQYSTPWIIASQPFSAQFTTAQDFQNFVLASTGGSFNIANLRFRSDRNCLSTNLAGAWSTIGGGTYSVSFGSTCTEYWRAAAYYMVYSQPSAWSAVTSSQLTVTTQFMYPSQWMGNVQQYCNKTWYGGGSSNTQQWSGIHCANVSTWDLASPFVQLSFHALWTPTANGGVTPISISSSPLTMTWIWGIDCWIDDGNSGNKTCEWEQGPSTGPLYAYEDGICNTGSVNSAHKYRCYVSDCLGVSLTGTSTLCNLNGDAMDCESTKGMCQGNMGGESGFWGQQCVANPCYGITTNWNTTCSITGSSLDWCYQDVCTSNLCTADYQFCPLTPQSNGNGYQGGYDGVCTTVQPSPTSRRTCVANQCLKPTTLNPYPCPFPSCSTLLSTTNDGYCANYTDPEVVSGTGANYYQYCVTTNMCNEGNDVGNACWLTPRQPGTTALSSAQDIDGMSGTAYGTRSSTGPGFCVNPMATDYSMACLPDPCPYGNGASVTYGQQTNVYTYIGGATCNMTLGDNFAPYSSSVVYGVCQQNWTTTQTWATRCQLSYCHGKAIGTACNPAADVYPPVAALTGSVITNVETTSCTPQAGDNLNQLTFSGCGSCVVTDGHVPWIAGSLSFGIGNAVPVAQCRPPQCTIGNGNYTYPCSITGNLYDGICVHGVCVPNVCQSSNTSSQTFFHNPGTKCRQNVATGSLDSYCQYIPFTSEPSHASTTIGSSEGMGGQFITACMDAPCVNLATNAIAKRCPSNLFYPDTLDGQCVNSGPDGSYSGEPNTPLPALPASHSIDYSNLCRKNPCTFQSYAHTPCNREAFTNRYNTGSVVGRKMEIQTGSPPPPPSSNDGYCAYAGNNEYPYIPSTAHEYFVQCVEASTYNSDPRIITRNDINITNINVQKCIEAYTIEALQDLRLECEGWEVYDPSRYGYGYGSYSNNNHVLRGKIRMLSESNYTAEMEAHLKKRNDQLAAKRQAKVQTGDSNSQNEQPKPVVFVNQSMICQHLENLPTLTQPYNYMSKQQYVPSTIVVPNGNIGVDNSNWNKKKMDVQAATTKSEERKMVAQTGDGVGPCENGCVGLTFDLLQTAQIRQYVMSGGHFVIIDNNANLVNQLFGFGIQMRQNCQWRSPAGQNLMRTITTRGCSRQQDIEFSIDFDTWRENWGEGYNPLYEMTSYNAEDSCWETNFLPRSVLPTVSNMYSGGAVVLQMKYGSGLVSLIYSMNIQEAYSLDQQQQGTGQKLKTVRRRLIPQSGCDGCNYPGAVECLFYDDLVQMITYYTKRCGDNGFEHAAK